MAREVAFTVHCADTRVGFHLRVVGNIHGLGKWSPQNGLKMATTAADFPLWSSEQITMQEDEVIEYKYVICDNNGNPERWEERHNRSIHLASLAAHVPKDVGVVVSEPFNNPTNPPEQMRFLPAEDAIAARSSSKTNGGSFIRALDKQSEEGGGLFAPTIRERSHSLSIMGSPMPRRNSKSLLGMPDLAGPSEPEVEDTETMVAAMNPYNMVREESSSNLFLGQADSDDEDHASSSEFEDKYLLLGNGPLGEGTFGLVWRCSMKTKDGSSAGDERAAKIIRKARLQPRDLRYLLGDEQHEGEVRTHLALNHAHIVRLCECFDGLQTVTLILEYCRGGDLFDAILKQSRASSEEQQNAGAGSVIKRGLPEVAAKRVMQHLLSALGYIHEKGVVHRDIKCENILLLHNGIPVEENILKLCDFGFAVYDRGEGLRDRLGSPDTVAPEVVIGSNYSTLVDIWSAGVLLYMTLSATPPFFAGSDREVLQRVRAGNYSMVGKLWDTISPACKDLVRSLMTVDTSQRPAAKAALQMAWLSSQD